MLIRAQLILALLLSGAAYGQVGPAPGVGLNDEGAVQGRVQTLNCVGSGITCSKSGITGTLSISGGGSGNFLSVELDFGQGAGADIASVVVTGQSWVTASSVIVCSPTMIATADRGEGDEDAVIEQLTVAIHTRVASTGFTLTATPGLGVTTGKFAFHCTGA
jgi:hypothetical protein